MFRVRYVHGPVAAGGEDSAYSAIPLLPELELISSSLAVGDDFSMEGLRRAMLASDTLDDPNGLTSLHDSSAMDYDTDASELYKLTQMKLQSSSDPILHDRRLQDDDDDDEHDDGHVMYTELTTSGFRHCSPGSEGESSFDQDLSDCSSSDSALDSPSSAMKWETIAECHVTPMSGDTDGPLPPVTDIFSSRMGKDDFLDLSTHRSLPCLIKTEVESEDEVMDNSMPPLLQIVPTALAHNVYSTLPVSVPSPTIPISSTTPDDVTTTATAAATTTNNSNHHDYTTTQGVDENNNERRVESSRRGTHSRVATHENGEKCQRKKPGRKKGQVSKVLHLWEFIRDLLSDPQYCPRIINWENEREGVFRVMQSSEVARLWGEKKKNKKTMTYEKLSRSLRYSRKEGYFDALPKDMGYPKKLCFKFGPKSHGWRDFALKP